MRSRILLAIGVFVLLFSACAKDRLAERRARYQNESERQRFALEHNLGHLPSSDVPLEINDRVVAWMDYFQGAGRNHFQRYLERSGRYIKMMRDILKENGLPQDLVYVALIESGFNNSAYSRAHAVGPWQFIRGTGARYGLEIGNWVDERRDPVKSTWAAARYLRDLYQEFGDWYLAMAAYNAGEGRIRDAIDQTGTRKYWDMTDSGQRYLRAETRDYVPKYIAAAIIAKMPQNFGFTNVSYQKPLAFDIATVETQTDIDVIAQCTGVDTDTISDLNPHLVRGSTPPGMRNYSINLPKGTTQTFKAKYAALPESERVKIAYHKVRRGETAVSIARHYGISTSALLAANDISLKQKKLHKGAMLVIPRGGAAQSYEEADNDTERTVRVKKMVAYRVKRGDTVSKIASHHGVTVAQIKGWNSITKRNPLRVGRTLKIYQQVAVAKASQKKESKQLAMADNQSRKRKTKEQIEGQKYSIKAGESLWTIAKRYNMSVDELVAINGLEAGAKVKAGQKIIVTMAQGRTALDVTEPASTADKEVADTADTDVAGKEPTAKEGSDDGSSDQDNTGKTIAMATASEASPDDIALGKRVPKSSPKVDNAKMSNVVDKEAKKQASKEAKIRETKADTTVRVTKKYTMKKGDSLAVVARKHGVSVPELMKWNQIKNPKAIRAGQVIKIQSMAAKNQPKEPKRETISQKQEARNKKQDVTEQKVREEQPETAENESLTSPVIVNDTKNPDDAATSSTTPQNGVKKEGVPLKLSDTPTPASESSLNYHVKDGDTLWDIARRHKVTIAELQKWNSLSDPSAVKPGDSLTIRRQ